MMGEANPRTIREAIDAALTDGTPSLLEATGAMPAEDARSFALKLIRDLKAEDGVETWVVKGQWLHVGPFGYRPGAE